MPKVFVTNKSFHDFGPARKFGRLVFLTEGFLPLHSVNSLYRLCIDSLRTCEPEDYLLVTGPAILNAVAASIVARRHGVINYLTYDRRAGDYTHERISLEWIDTLSSDATNESDT